MGAISARDGGTVAYLELNSLNVQRMLQLGDGEVGESCRAVKMDEMASLRLLAAVLKLDVHVGLFVSMRKYTNLVEDIMEGDHAAEDAEDDCQKHASSRENSVLPPVHLRRYYLAFTTAHIYTYLTIYYLCAIVTRDLLSPPDQLYWRRRNRLVAAVFVMC